jgi:hypothetical protein
MPTVGELVALFPTCATIDLRKYDGRSPIKSSYTDVRVSAKGFPLPGTAEEGVISRWTSLHTKLIVGVPPENSVRPTIASGEAVWMLTQRAIRASFIMAVSEQLGTFSGGWRGKAMVILSFRWPLEAVDCVSTYSAFGKPREVSIQSIEHRASLIAHDIQMANDKFIAKGLGMVNRAGEFAESLIDAVAGTQSQLEGRRERCEAVLRGERVRDDHETAAWFVSPKHV